jgi:hypothetical protein
MGGAVASAAIVFRKQDDTRGGDVGGGAGVDVVPAGSEDREIRGERIRVN